MPTDSSGAGQFFGFFVSRLLNPGAGFLNRGRAASVAGLLVTTEAMVAEIPEKKETPPMPDMGGMDF